jgi:hypothetical protein
LSEHCRNWPPRNWFVARHGCHFAKQRLCLATQTKRELARSERTASAKAPRRPVGNAELAIERHAWSGAAAQRSTCHQVSCNDLLGRSRVGPQRRIPRRRPRLSRVKFVANGSKLVLVASKLLKIVLGGTAASHTRSGVGGGHFLIKKSDHRCRAAVRD